MRYKFKAIFFLFFFPCRHKSLSVKGKKKRKKKFRFIFRFSPSGVFDWLDHRSRFHVRPTGEGPPNGGLRRGGRLLQHGQLPARPFQHQSARNWTACLAAYQLGRPRSSLIFVDQQTRGERQQHPTPSSRNISNSIQIVKFLCIGQSKDSGQVRRILRTL